MKSYGRLLKIGALAILLAATAAWAADPPGRVARLQYMGGSVSIQPRGTEDWVQGSANRPLTNADNIWADKDSRAELNLGTALMRMNSETSLTLSNVSNEAVQVQLHQGTLNLHVRHLYGGEVYEIDTPNLAFTVTKPGDYRFDTDPNGDSTLVTVRRGEGEATGKGPAVKVKSGKQARFTGGTSLAHQILDAPQPDSFDSWCQVRDEREDHSLSAKYVAPGVVGYEDLDTYGTWRDTPEYGRVWVPASVPPDWAPYRYGHWVWIDPWGWTWVDDAPWGFAPFHYGRWVWYGGYWGWAPGPYWVRPWYAPAMVAWFGGPGWGLGWGFGFGWGFGWGWGWAPLGWGEPFFPWWGHCGPGYFRNVNISNTHITNINNITNVYNNSTGTQGFYGNRGVATPRYAMSHNGLTAASNNTLQHSLPVQSNMAKVPESALHNLPSAKGPDVSPTHDSTLGGKTGSPVARPTSAAASRPTVSRMTPPAPARTSSAEASAARGSEGQAGRGPETSSARNAEAPAASHGPESSATGSHSATGTSPTEGRDVPRSGQSSNEGSREVGNASHIPASNYVPRPPSAWGSRSLSGSEPSRSGTTQMAMNTVPRPPEGSFSRPTVSAGNSSGATRSYSSPGSNRSGSYNVPRPTGPVRPAPGESASSGYGRSNGRWDNESSSYHHGYGQGRSYGSQGGSYGHYSSPSHSSGGSHGSWGGSHGGSSGGSHSGGGGHR
jgi:hypothetical protein